MTWRIFGHMGADISAAIVALAAETGVWMINILHRLVDDYILNFDIIGLL